MHYIFITEKISDQGQFKDSGFNVNICDTPPAPLRPSTQTHTHWFLYFVNIYIMFVDINRPLFLNFHYYLFD